MKALRLVASATFFAAAFAIVAAPANAAKTATYASDPKIELTTVTDFDTILKDGQTIQNTLDGLYKNITDAKTNVNTTLGVATDSPLSTALDSLKTSAAGKVSVALNGTVPSLSAKDAPSNVQKGVDAVNALITAGKDASDKALGLKDQVTTLGKNVAALPPKILTMAKSLTADQLKNAPGILSTDAKAVKAMPTNIQAITDSVTSIFTDVTNAFKS